MARCVVVINVLYGGTIVASYNIDSDSNDIDAAHLNQLSDSCAKVTLSSMVEGEVPAAFRPMRGIVHSIVLLPDYTLETSHTKALCSSSGDIMVILSLPRFDGRVSD